MRRYNGNTGRYEYIPDQRPTLSSKSQPHGQHLAQAPNAKMRSDFSSPQQGRSPLPGARDRSPQPSKDLLGSLQSTLANLFSQGFENEDLLLFAVLFLMYQETHDKELLIIMGGMFLL